MPYPYPNARDIEAGVTNTEIELVTGLRDQWRASKDEGEIASLERAALVTDQVFAEICLNADAGPDRGKRRPEDFRPLDRER